VVCLKHTKDDCDYYAQKLGNNNFGFIGVVIVADAVRRRNSTYIRSNYTFYRPYDALTELKLKGNNFRNAGMQLLVNAFRSCTHLHTIDLSINNISSLGIKALADYLEEPNTIIKGRIRIGSVVEQYNV
jgi:hypothetical protein